MIIHVEKTFRAMQYPKCKKNITRRNENNIRLTKEALDFFGPGWRF